ncbi:MAG: type II secretion system protein [Nitrospirae bacterium]|nr:type II secretion system protein [Nitrospirota bacterium]
MRRKHPISQVREMKTERGYSFIELLVVITIVSILVGVFTYNVVVFLGTKTKNNIESNIKQLYTDLSEMRVRSMAENRTFGIFINNTTPSQRFDFTTYQNRCDGVDLSANGTCAVNSTSDGKITDSGGYVTLRTATLQSQADPITLFDAIQVFAFTDKGIAITEIGGTLTSTFPNVELQLYSSCRACDHKTSACNAEDPTTTCQGAATPTSCNASSPGCDDSSYPEYSCLTVSMTRIKMGKWCDLDCNGAYDSGECVIK